MSAIAIFDIGKTNARLSLVSASNGDVLNSVSRESPALEQAPYLHLDTDGLWQWYLEQLRDAQKLAPISHICVAAHGGSAALIDNDGLVLPVLDYEFAGPDELASEYDQICSPFDQTYSPRLPHGMNVGRQLYWQRANFPERFARARHLLGYAQYWGWLLTGVAAGEYTTLGAHTDLWNPVARDFSSLAVREGFAALVPPIQRSDEVLGRLRNELCRHTGIDESCEVLTGIHDSNASLLPYLQTRDAPFTVVSTGTWVISFAIGAPLDKLVADRDCIANVNLFGDPVACTRYMGGREFGTVAGDTITPGSLDMLANLLDESIFVLPGFTSEGGPFQNLEGRIDCQRKLSPAERTTLASVYCALVTDICLSLCGSLGDIIIEGVYAKNTMLMQVLNTLRGDQTVSASTDNTGTTVGAAMLATRNIAAPHLEPTSALDTSMSEKILNYRNRWNKAVTRHRQAAGQV